MNTRLLMIASAIFMGGVGLLLTFAPETVGQYLDMPANASILLQLLGAVYLGFAMLNWMGRGLLIGGIYSKPVSTANYAHFFVGVFALVRFAFRSEDSIVAWAIAIIYLLFAVAFAYVTFSAPKMKVGT